MKVLIIEDEIPAAKRLQKMVTDIHSAVQIVGVLDSVESSVDWFNQQHAAPDLIFMDIQLADGLSFDIFSKTNISAPVIFTTAFDQYALKAFKVNSIDYLLKPIDPEELTAAIDKFQKHFTQTTPAIDNNTIERLVAQLSKPRFRERFLVKMGQQISYINVDDIAYFYSENGLIHTIDIKGKRSILDFTLDQLEGEVDPNQFFRINRKIILRLDAIAKMHTYFNSRLKLDLQPDTGVEAIVSRDRVNRFKQWIDR